jgi:hypothetical protein
MKMRYLCAAAAMGAALTIAGAADAAKVGRLTGCAVWTPPGCVMMGTYSLAGAPVSPWMVVSVTGRVAPGGGACPGTTFVVKSVTYQGWCWAPR